MKINKRLIRIALISLAAAIVLTALIYGSLKATVQGQSSEKRVPVLYFNYSMSKGKVLNETDLKTELTPASLVPKNAIKSPEMVRNKKLTMDVEAGEMVLSGKLVERGDTRADVKKLWTIGIDVTNISMCLGGNLKEGGDYILLYKDPAGNIIKVAKVRIASLIDSLGKLITATGDGVVKTINISVESEEIMLNIAQAKGVGTFDLVDAPEGYDFKPTKFSIGKSKDLKTVTSTTVPTVQEPDR